MGCKIHSGPRGALGAVWEVSKGWRVLPKDICSQPEAVRPPVGTCDPSRCHTELESNFFKKGRTAQVTLKTQHKKKNLLQVLEKSS